MRCDGVGDATVLADGVNAGAYALRYEGRGELSRDVGVEAIDAVGAGAGAAASASLRSSACRAARARNPAFKCYETQSPLGHRRQSRALALTLLQ